MQIKSDKKPKLILLALVATCLSLIANPSLAYIRQQVLTKNVITMDQSIKIELNEYSLDQDGNKVAFQNIDGIMPGLAYPKIVQIKNIGSQPAYIRIKLQIEAKLDSGQKPSLPNSELVKLDFQRDWQKKGDYWYYTGELASNQETPPLFTKVTFSPKIDRNYMGSKIMVKVKAYATQVKHNGNSALDAQGWPVD